MRRSDLSAHHKQNTEREERPHSVTIRTKVRVGPFDLGQLCGSAVDGSNYPGWVKLGNNLATRARLHWLRLTYTTGARIQEGNTPGTDDAEVA